jgi:hypothetical protein
MSCAYLEQGILYNVFAVHDRSRHARTVPVQARPELYYGLQERAVSVVEKACRIDVL